MGKVTAAVHTANFKGPITKSVTVTTNDPENAHFTLQLKANVLVPVDIQPSENISFMGKADQLKPQELTIVSADKSNFDITEVVTADQNFKIVVVAAPEEGTAPKPKSGCVASGANRYKVTVSPAANLAVGRVNSSITLKTTHPKAAELPIRIYGNVLGDVEVSPQQVTLSTGPQAAAEAKVQHIAIKKATGDPLKISGVTSDNAGVTTALKTVTDGREYDLEVKYTGEPLTMALTAKVTLKTNDPRQPSIDLPVWGRVDAGMRVQAPGMPTAVPGGPGQSPVTIRPMPLTPPSGAPTPAPAPKPGGR